MSLHYSFSKSAALLVSLQFVFLSTSSAAVPSGFNEILSKTGVIVYKKDYSGGSPDYVQVIDLSQGAQIKLMTGSKADNGTNQGSYGGDNPSINRQSLSVAWDDFSSQESAAVCITNGQFFATNANPTTLAFPVKINGDEIDGYGSDEYFNQKLVLGIYDDHAEINSFSESVNDLPTNAIVGLSEDANKSPNTYTGRTFFGVADDDNDGNYETVLIFNSKSTRQSDAAQVLYDFGANSVVMLDGGGSTQLICDGQSLVSSSRAIPQTIGVISGGSHDSSNTTWTTGAYGNDEDKSKILSIPNANSLTVTVSGTTESGYDYLYIYDENNIEVKKLDGSINENFVVNGSSIKARLVTDYLVTESGVSVTIVAGGSVESSQNDQDIESFYNDYPNYFGTKLGDNYSCYSSYTCQNFTNGKKIAVHNQNKSLHWYNNGWNIYRNNY